MNIKDIMHQPGQVARTGVMPDRSPFLSIGKKGQVVEGVISKVSDKISISFNGIEVAVPHSAVRNATEGGTRKFQIMDVSKDNIVLNEMPVLATLPGWCIISLIFIDFSPYVPFSENLYIST